MASALPVLRFVQEPTDAELPAIYGMLPMVSLLVLLMTAPLQLVISSLLARYSSQCDRSLTQSTPALVQFLQSNNEITTHFMIGSNILYYPSQFMTAFNAGHDIADHTYTHPYLTTKNNLDVLGEVSSCPTISEPRIPLNNNLFSLGGQCNSSPILPEAVFLNFGDRLMVIQISGLALLPEKSVLFPFNITHIF